MTNRNLNIFFTIILVATIVFLSNTVHATHADFNITSFSATPVNVISNNLVDFIYGSDGISNKLSLKCPQGITARSPEGNQCGTLSVSALDGPNSYSVKFVNTTSTMLNVIATLTSYNGAGAEQDSRNITVSVFPATSLITQTTDVTAKIQALFDQVKALQAQIAQLQGQYTARSGIITVGNPTAPTTNTSPSITFSYISSGNVIGSFANLPANSQIRFVNADTGQHYDAQSTIVRVGGSGPLSITVPNDLPNGKYYLRATDYYNPNKTIALSGPFQAGTTQYAPTVTGNSTQFTDVPTTITWTRKQFPSSGVMVEIRGWQSGSESKSFIMINSYADNTGSYPYQSLPTGLLNSSGEWVVRVTDYNNRSLFAESAPFKVSTGGTNSSQTIAVGGQPSGQPSINITSPVVDTTFILGNKLPITWSSINLKGKVSAYLLGMGQNRCELGSARVSSGSASFALGHNVTCSGGEGNLNPGVYSVGLSVKKAPDSVSPARIHIISYDLDENGRVDGADLAFVLASFGTCPSNIFCRTDFNRDGVVNYLDSNLLISHYGSI